MTWNLLKNEAYQDARLKGFHDVELSDEHYIVMIMTELAEAVEADRKNKHAHKEEYKQYEIYADKSECFDSVTRSGYLRSCFEQLIKDTVEDELADVVIRVLDLAGLRGISLETFDDDDVYCMYDSPEMMDDFAEQPFTEVIFELSQMLFRCYYNPYEGLNERRLKAFFAYVLYYCMHNGINIEWHVEKKMEYNRDREKLHGKNY